MIQRSLRVRHFAWIALTLSLPAAAGSVAAPWTTISQVRMGTTMGIVTTLQLKQRMEKQNAARATARTASPTGGSATARPAAAIADGDLSIAADPQVTAQARHAFIGALVQSSGMDVGREADRMLGNIRATFSSVSQPYGLRADDLGDVMTAYMVVMWMAVNQETALPEPASVQAVRQQMREAFSAAAGRVPEPAQRQLMAEGVMYQTCMAILVRQQAQLQSKPELLASLGSAIDHNMSSQGFSLANMALTDRGLVPR